MNLSRMPFLGLILITAAASTLPGITHAQAPDKFEVASVRPDPSGSLNTRINMQNGRLSIQNASLKTLIRNAYSIQSFQFGEGPKWLDTNMYDIEATTGTGQNTTDDQFKTLLKNLLADYFGLKVHWETREGPVYALVVAKGGPRIKQSAETKPDINGSRFGHEGHMKGTDEPLSVLASNLGNQVQQTVIDKTGLSGGYDWVLAWDPNPGEDATNPSIFDAVQEQLGLKLDRQKGPNQTLVIDDAHLPPNN